MTVAYNNVAYAHDCDSLGYYFININIVANKPLCRIYTKDMDMTSCGVALFTLCFPLISKNDGSSRGTKKQKVWD